ncbi:MAG: PFL family protein [Acutalibacteraceae bacterium]|nr:PFL family protein [Acutalibacteraceae bacterium]
MTNIFEVRETNKMIEENNLDVRTITMGISLLDCCSDSVKKTCQNIYNKITKKAENLVKVGKEIELDFGIPIVNKRVSVTPISLIGSSCCSKIDDYVEIAKTLDRAADTIGVNFIGGFSALVSKGMTPSDKLLIESIPKALATTNRVCSSVNVGSTKTGIDMDAVKLIGETIVKTAELTKDNGSIGCAKFVVFCNAPDDNPFMAGAFHGVTEADTIINVGVSGPGVVKRAIAEVKGQSFGTLCETIKKTAFKVTRVGQLVAQEASKRLDIPFGIIDLSLAPTPAVGDSVAEILEEMGLERVGAPGTTAALALLNDQVKKGGIMASSYVGGLSGAFIPVSEDQGMIDAVNAGALTLEKLEAMTCVCSVGLDMIAIPGNTKASTISGIIADEMAIGMINQKTTAVRLIPVFGKDIGDTVEFGGLLGYAPIMKVNEFDCESFISRGGRIPAPIHSFKN